MLDVDSKMIEKSGPRQIGTKCTEFRRCVLKIPPLQVNADAKMKLHFLTLAMGSVPLVPLPEVLGRRELQGGLQGYPSLGLEIGKITENSSEMFDCLLFV